MRLMVPLVRHVKCWENSLLSVDERHSGQNACDLSPHHSRTEEGLRTLHPRGGVRSYTVTRSPLDLACIDPPYPQSVESMGGSQCPVVVLTFSAWSRGDGDTPLRVRRGDIQA